MGCVPAPWAGADSHWLSATRDLALPLKTTPPARDPPAHPPILPQASRPSYPTEVLPESLPFWQG